MNKSRAVCVCALLLVALLAVVEGRGSSPDQGNFKNKIGEKNVVSKQCPHGEVYFMGCVSCMCETVIHPSVLEQFPKEHRDVCTGKRPPDCPKHECRSVDYHDECEGECKCDNATKITTCERWACPYE